MTWNPDTFRPGTRMWSVPVATGTASGWVEVNGTRVIVNGWRAYHDHTWGEFSLAAVSWYHSDFAVVSPRPGEAWIVNGLQPGEGSYRTEPDERAWQGVLVHAAGKRVLDLLPAEPGPRELHAPNGLVRVPPRRRVPRRRRFGIAQEVGSSAPTPGGTGWIAHAMPPLPNM